MRRLRRGLVALAVAVTSLATTPSTAFGHTPHDDVWSVAASPAFADDGTILAIVRGIVVRSTDGGASWHRLVNGLDNLAQPYAFSYAGRSNRDVYLVTGDGVFRSNDGGDRWQRTLTSSAKDLRLVATTTADPEVAVAVGNSAGPMITSNGGVSWRTLPGFGAPTTAVAFKKRSTRVLFAGDSNGTLHMTYDGGARWIHAPLPGVGAVTALAVSPSFRRDRTVLIGTDVGGVLRWDHATKSATPANEGLTDLRVTSIAYSANFAYDRTVFASTWTDGTYVSHDAGRSWRRSSRGLVTDPQASEPAYDRPSVGRVVSVIADPATRETTELLASFTGVYRSTDLGATWSDAAVLAPSTITGLAVSPQFGTDGRVAVMTYVNAAARSHDRGATWASSNLGLGQPNYWAAGPDRYLRGFNIAYSPTVGSRQWMFLGSDPGVYRSSDGGASWSLTQVPGFANPRITTQPVSPRVFVSPTFADDQTVLMVDTAAGDVYRSVDEGASFQKVGVVPSRVHCLVAAPTFAVDRRLMACTGRGVYVTTDYGTTWAPTRPLLMHDLAITTGGGTETWFAATSFGLHRSTDRGASWVKVALPAPTGSSPIVGAVGASPPAPGAAATVLVSTKGKGLYRSSNGGASFHEVGAPLLAGNEQLDTYPYRNTGSPIVFSPAFALDRTIFGASHDALFRSTDAGSSWQRLDVPVATHSGPLPSAPAP